MSDLQEWKTGSLSDTLAIVGQRKKKKYTTMTFPETIFERTGFSKRTVVDPY